MDPPRPLRVLGIDPGTLRMGYAVLVVADVRSPQLLASGVLEAAARDTPSQRLGSLFRELMALIELHAPDQVAVESSFFGKNALSMLRLGEARGCALAAAGAHRLPATDYSPASVKKAVTGNGNASKQQVARILAKLLPELGAVEELGRLDETDAIAVAFCHVTTAARRERIANSWSAAVAAANSVAARRSPPPGARNAAASGTADAWIARWRSRR